MIDNTISNVHKCVPFMAAYLKDYFLKTLMHMPEFMKIDQPLLSQETIHTYNVQGK